MKSIILRFEKCQSFHNLIWLFYFKCSLNGQAFHIVCMNKRKNYWFTTASRTLTEYT